jgi:hypothetical protein
MYCILCAYRIVISSVSSLNSWALKWDAVSAYPFAAFSNLARLIYTLKMEVVYSSETLVHIWTTRRYIPEVAAFITTAARTSNPTRPSVFSVGQEIII